MTTVINTTLNVAELPQGCGCSQCMQIGAGFSENNGNTNNDGDVFAPSVTATPTQFANYLTNGFWEDSGRSARQWDTATDNNVTYNLSNSYTESQKAGIRAAFDTWADVANLTFSEVSSGQDITIQVGNDGRAYSGSSVYISSGNIASNTISMDTSESFWSNFNEYGDYAMITAIHEIGHSLGLGHTGNYNGTATYANDAQFINDSRQYSVMSYFNASLTGANHQGEYASTPLIYDIVAIQNKYGANNSARAGDTTYGFNTTETGSEFDFTANIRPVIAIWDGAGTDTIDVSGWSSTQMINLNDGEFSNVGGGTGNLAIAFNAEIENVNGGSGLDTIYGNELDNTLNGNAGADIFHASLGDDTINGGEDADKVVYNYNFADLTFQVQSATSILVTSSSGSFSDTVNNVETFEFNDVTYTFAELSALVSYDTIQLKYAGENDDGLFSRKLFVSDAANALDGDDLGYAGDSDAYFSYTRGANETLDITNANGVSTPVNTIAIRNSIITDISVTGFETSIIQLDSMENLTVDIETAQTGRVVTAGGGDTITLSNFNVFDNGLSTNYDVYSGSGNDNINVSLSSVFTTNIYAGAGNDEISGIGNSGAMIVYGDAGSDSLIVGASDSIEFYGGSGTDTVIYSGDVSNYTFRVLNSDTILVGEVGDSNVAHVISAENFVFNGNTESFANLAGYANMDTIQLRFAGSNDDGVFGNKYFSTGGGTTAIDGERFGMASSAELLTLSRTSNANLSLTNASGGVDFVSLGTDVLTTLNISGFAGSSLYMTNTSGVSTTVAGAQYSNIYGASGDDTINLTTDGTGSTGSSINSYDGEDNISYSGSNASLNITINAGGDDDVVTITGTSWATIFAGTGDDTITGGDSGDVIYGQSGTNTLRGGEGSDLVRGGTGIDTIYGDNGNDNLYGGDLGDTIYGGNGQDVISGESGNDFLYGQSDFDVIFGGAGNDRLEGGEGIDILYGQDDNDILFGGGVDADRLYGGSGDDTVVGDGSRDLLYGQTGADVFSVRGGGFTYDRFMDFRLNEGDTLNFTDILTSYTDGVDDLNDFLIVEDRGSTTLIWADTDGTGSGDSWSAIAQIFDGNTLDGQNVNSLLANNDLIVDSSII